GCIGGYRGPEGARDLRLDLLRRQLAAATEGVTLTAPARDLRGDRLSPSTGLSLIAHLLGKGKAEDLLADLRAMPPEAWPIASTCPPPSSNTEKPELPEDGTLHLGMNLLHLRPSADGTPVPQSPSRLETLLVSPLAWLLDEIGAKERTWAPETLDVLVLGTLLHKVVEIVFPAGIPIPADDEIEAQVAGALRAAISADAPWLLGSAWAAECASLLQEARRMTLAWARFLRECHAEILHNEVDLAGDQSGLPVAGRADCLLRLPDGRLLVVDHKRSSARSRLERMQKGWDLQVALYRAMLECPTEGAMISNVMPAGVRTVTAYHTMLDASVLVDAEGTGIPGAEAVTSDISQHALSHLRQLVHEVSRGEVRLNHEGDLARLQKECGIVAYPLKDNALVSAFLMPEGEAE
ncbi:MAG: PD-(D/E)XK nuclease family protein, partial [Alphaproteobacteria bacterium]|nr:PD-(D/E)XK nuclease family protein [Alphaproteobacteria bacterium]MDX5370253.1 PD-(D/E)XK nuclease family protein [Alphaproteobacteria bacterium]